MSALLEIQPRELKFVVELGKQSKCTVRLTNRTDQYVAFKVKTTSPKRYCVRPNVGVLQSKGSIEFVVIMQTQKSGVIDYTCKDKFLIQNTIVPEGTEDEDITSELFSKDGGRYVEESKLRVFLISPPPSSPDLTPIDGMLKQAEEPAVPKTKSNGVVKPEKTKNEQFESSVGSYEFKPLNTTMEHEMSRNVTNEELKQLETAVEHAVPKSVKTESLKPVRASVDHVMPKPVSNEAFKPVKTAMEQVAAKIIENGDVKPVKEAEVDPFQDENFELIKFKNVMFEPTRVEGLNDIEDVESEPKKDVEIITTASKEATVMEPRISVSEEEQKLFKDVEEMKSKLCELESKLSKAELTISKLAEERRLAFQDREKLQQEMAFLRKRKAERKIHDGFPLLFVCMVAIISLVAGYGFRP